MENKKIKPAETEEKQSPWVLLLFSVIIIILVYSFMNFLPSQSDVKTANNKVTNGSVSTDDSRTGEEYTDKSGLPRADKEELNANYVTMMDSIKVAYSEAKEKNDRNEWLKFSHDALGKMFNAVITAEHKEFHLKLTITLNAINKLSTSVGEDDKFNEELVKLDGMLKG